MLSRLPPVSRTLSHDRVSIGRPAYSRRCAHRQQCALGETQLEESVFSWGTQWGQCHRRDKDRGLRGHLGEAAAQLRGPGLPERGDITGPVCQRTEGEHCNRPASPSMGLNPQGARCGPRGLHAVRRLELRAEGERDEEEQSAARPRGPLEFAGDSGHKGDPQVILCPLKQRSLPRSPREVSGQHQARDSPHCGSAARSLAKMSYSWAPLTPTPGPTLCPLSKSCLNSRAFTWAGSGLATCKGQL